MENSSEGLWSRMQSGVRPKGGIALKDLEQTFSHIQKARDEEEELRQKRLEHNLDWLDRKSLELGEPIPVELLAVAYTESMVGSKFLEKYKEWIT